MTDASSDGKESSVHPRLAQSGPYCYIQSPKAVTDEKVVRYDRNELLTGIAKKMKQMLMYAGLVIVVPLFLLAGAASHVLGKLDTVRSNFLFGTTLLLMMVFDVIFVGGVDVKQAYLFLISAFATQGFLSTVGDLSARVHLCVAAICFGVALYVLAHGAADRACVVVMISSVITPIVVNRWWLPVSEDKLKSSEEVLLDLYIHNPDVEVSLQVVAGLGTYIVSEASDSDAYHARDTKIKGKIPLVLVHGYGAGNGYWALNIDGLSKAGFQVYCVELPGMGRSDRPTWESPRSTDEALERLASSLEAWRNEMGLHSFVLLGHSLGTHAASAYAIQHPSRVRHLILASPVGVGLPPLRLRKQLSREALDCAEEGGVDLSVPETSGGANTHAATPVKSKEMGDKEKLLPKSPAAEVQATMSKPLQEQPFLFRSFVAVASWLWTHEFTPFDVTRLMGPFGPSVTAWAFRRRIGRSAQNSYMRKLSPEQVSALDTYSYQNHAAPASGERILNSILMPGAYARKPLVLWLRGGRGKGFIKCPVTLLYGSKGVDWMQAEYGSELCANLREEGVDAVCLEMGNEVGHLNYLEDPAQFVAHLEEQVIARKRL